MTEPYELTVAEASNQIRIRALSPVELTKSLLNRIDTLESRLIAWACLVPEQALTEAKTLEDEAMANEFRSTIHGVPYGPKDLFDTQGIITAAGFGPWANRVPEADSTCVKKMKDAGAIMLGKTHTCELADGHPAPSRNPWNTEHTPGGSSAGSAVGVAARMMPAALGSQTLSSTLRPSSYNGIIGYKPTFGLISRAGMIPQAPTFDHVGILVRTVEDASILVTVLAGYDPRDADSISDKVSNYTLALHHRDRAPIIGILAHYFELAEADVRTRTESALRTLEAAGAEIRVIDPGFEITEVLPNQWIIQTSEAAASYQSFYVGDEDSFQASTRSMIDAGFKHSGVAYANAREFRKKTRAALAESLSQIDVLLSPCTPTPAPHGLAAIGDPSFQTLWSFTGFPAISIPIGTASNGMPIGIQVGTNAWRDTNLLSHARWIEETVNVQMVPPI